MSAPDARRRKPPKINEAVLNRLFQQHGQALWSAWRSALEFEHMGSRGELREDGVARFLRNQLPHRYSLTPATAVDARGQRSSQLDLVLYDSLLNVPLFTQEGTRVALLPAEALLAVVEIKSTLDAKQVALCLQNAESVRKLRPYGKSFVTRLEGESDRSPRCFYSVLAYSSDLSEGGWLANEWRRWASIAAKNKVDVSIVDRIVVLERGILAPPFNKGHMTPAPGASLLTWYLHLGGFLARESGRRLAVEPDQYARGHLMDWELLDDSMPRPRRGQRVQEGPMRPADPH